MALSGRRLASPGTALGCGPAAWAAVAYREPLRTIVRAGVVDAVGDGIFATAHARGDRAAGFWFLFAAPLVALTGYLTQGALDDGNGRAARVAGGTTLGLGLIGSVVIPRSGFPVAVPIGYWLLRRGRALDHTRRAGDVR